jgi:hypothetical protein
VTGKLAQSWVAFDDIAVEGVFKYSAGPEAGTNLTYSPWSPGQPDNSANEDCGSLWYSLPNNWNDAPCSALLGYAIEYECSTGLEMTLAGCQGSIHDVQLSCHRFTMT